MAVNAFYTSALAAMHQLAHKPYTLAQRVAVVGPIRCVRHIAVLVGCGDYHLRKILVTRARCPADFNTAVRCDAGGGVVIAG